MRADCPLCKKWAEGEIVIKILFGLRYRKTKIYPQPYCKECREHRHKELIDEKRKLVIENRSINRVVSQALYERHREEIDMWVDSLLAYTKFEPVIAKKEPTIDIAEVHRMELPKLEPSAVATEVKIDLLEGLTDSQKTTIKRLVGKGYHPLGFDVLVEQDRIFYFGKEVA